MKKNEKTVNLEELLKGIVEASGKVPVSGIRVLVKKIPGTQDDKPVCNQPADEPMHVKSMPVKPATDKPTTGCKDEPANSGKDMPICIHIDNVHIHMDESVTSNYGPGALAGISSDDDIDDEAFDEENCHSSCDHCGEEEDPFDFDEMLKSIHRHTGLCEKIVLAVLSAQNDYLETVYGKEV